MSNLYELYRYTNTDRSTKDWAVCNHGDGSYTSCWGKTGAKVQSKTFKNMLSMQDHIRSKTNKGYVYIGTAIINDDGKLEVGQWQTTEPVVLNPAPIKDPEHIYWRIRFPPSFDTLDAGISFLKGSAVGYAISILRTYPDCSWVQNIHDGHGEFLKPSAGSLTKDNSVGSLLLLMALKKLSKNRFTIALSHEDGVEISDQLKMESDALSFFDTDLESIRQLAEEIGLLDKRLDLSTIAPDVKDYYF